MNNLSANPEILEFFDSIKESEKSHITDLYYFLVSLSEKLRNEKENLEYLFELSDQEIGNFKGQVNIKFCQ